MKAFWRGIEVAMRRPLHVLVPVALGLACGLGLALGLPASYRSTVSLAVELIPASEVLSPSMAAEAVRRQLPATRGEFSEEGLGGARGAVNVRAQGTDRVALDCVDVDPARSAAVANRLAARLVERAEAQRPKALPSSEELEQQVARARSELEVTEEAILRQSTAGAAVPGRPAAAAALERLEVERAAVTRRLRVAQASLEELRTQSPDPAVPPADPALAGLRQQLAVLRTRYTERHPDVQAVLRRIAEREAVVAAAATSPQSTDAADRVRRAQAEVETLSTQQARLDSEMGRLWAPAGNAPATGHDERLAALDRERTERQEAYRVLLKKRAEHRLAETRAREAPTALLRVISPATPPERPFFPNPWLFSGAGLLAGLMAGFGAALLAESRDRSVKNAEELEALLRLPLLAEIACVPKAPSRR